MMSSLESARREVAGLISVRPVRGKRGDDPQWAASGQLTKINYVDFTQMNPF
jgi:hypothetical protein